MAGKIPRQFIDELIARIDLVDLIESRIPLKKSGANYSARCPFHSEKTPSFSVNRDKQFYHCFGCGAHGNAIGFLMEYERLSFVESVELLAESLGLQVPTGEQKEQDQLALGLYDLQKQVASYYCRQLREHPEAPKAVEYLKNRGVTGEIAQRFLLGYAASAWQNLPPTFPADQLLRAGLVIAKEKGGFYDRFRERIMFPIRDRRGRVIGFGGRVMGEQTPKYLNSPETPVFKKHREVYGLYELLQTVPKPKQILVVEGYMDVIALAQAGVPYVAATLGTATSLEHVELLFRYTHELVFCFDGDRAGQNAAWKALETALPALREGRSIRFLLLPENHDPDSYVREYGKAQFDAALEQAPPLSDFFFEHFNRQFSLQTVEGRAGFFTAAKGLIGKVPAGVFREMMNSRLESMTKHVSADAIVEDTPFQRGGGNTGSRPTRPSALRTMLALLVQEPGLFGRLDAETRADLEGLGKAGHLIRRLFSLLDERPEITSGGILESFRDEPEEKYIKILSLWEPLIPPEGVNAEFIDAAKRALEQDKSARLEALVKKAKETDLNAEERDALRRMFGER